MILVWCPNCVDYVAMKVTCEHEEYWVTKCPVCKEHTAHDVQYDGDVPNE